MHRTKKRNFKWIVDLCMTLVLLCLMAYQVCGEVLHEWGGVVMTLLLIVHHILNRRWYASLFKGRYNAYRVVTVVVNTLLLGCIALTALCGMSMSAHAVPFLYGLLLVSFARQFHLALSYWSFVLMGFHLGLHVPAMTAGLKMNGKVKAILSLLCAGIAGVGVWLFLKNSLPDYMLFRTPFAFLDYDKAAVLVFAENLAMLIAFAHLGDCCANLCKAFGSHGKKRTFLSPLLLILLAIGISAFLFLCSGDSSEAGAAWDVPQVTESNIERDAAGESRWGETSPATDAAAISPQPAPAALEDGFVLLPGGSFHMGSPEAENWRIDDETLHTVTISAFYIDPYETTQAEYSRLMGSNPSAFQEAQLPVEQISWQEAIAFANAKSLEAGLIPAHTVSETLIAEESVPTARTDGKELIAFFSWGGNTRGIAREIQAQTGADLFEITPVQPYSTNYNIVLMEAQDDQHRQARPEIVNPPESIGPYDVILLGYPNGWASIPMPIASFLERYDFSGKTIVPFCSHGGGRFGQSLTAIAKLAPEAVLGEGLSVHYSGGASLPEDVAAWLEANGISAN